MMSDDLEYDDIPVRDNVDENQDEPVKPFEPQWPPWYSDVKEEFDLFKVNDHHIDQIIKQGFSGIAKALNGYQPREMQIRMAIKILKSLWSSETAVIEAGTGVGKSFAYLIAALAYSYMQGERILITTETKNLQWQLFEKDIPFLKDQLAEKLSHELCLGSGNYLCYLRYNEALDTGQFRDILDDDTQETLKGWVNTTKNIRTSRASIYELEKIMPATFWSSISRDSEGCPGQKCALFSDCTYYREKKKWERARLLTGNHHLLLYHLLNESRTLPTFAAVIIDEAHGFLKTAFGSFTKSFSRIGIQEHRKKFERFSKKSSLGLEKTSEILSALSIIENNWEAFFSAAETELGLSFSDNSTKTLEANLQPEPELLAQLKQLEKELKDILENEEDSTGLNNYKALSGYIRSAYDFVQSFPAGKDQSKVCWGEKKNGLFFLHICPLNPGEVFSELLNVPQVWTSATLGYWPNTSVPVKKSELIRGGYFQTFMEEALPSTDKKVNPDIYFSPFSYKKQSVLYIPEDMPAPPEFRSPEHEQEKYLQRLTSEIITLAEMSNGGALILFTSYAQLNRCGEYLSQNSDFTIISQADYGAARALEFFKKDPHALLLGTSSFWQGVDIPGYGLRMLIITKLMFQPPDDPIFQARSDLLQRKGGNPFKQLALPYSSGMLRQGFGRLIRSERDTGVIAILDTRVTQKFYGNILIANLPRADVATSIDNLKTMVNEKSIFKEVNQ